MSRFISRHIRITSIMVVTVCVILCAGLAARAANHVIEGKYLGESAESQLPPITHKRPSKKAPPQQTKNGDQLVERNIFCSECAPVVEEVPAAATSDGQIPLTSLPIELLATNLAGNPKSSFATIRNTQSSHQGAFFMGQSIPGAGPVEQINGTYVVFQNRESNRLEKLSLMSAAPVAKKPAATIARRPAAASPYSERVKKINDTTYEVEREIVEQFLVNPAKVGARATPVQKDGKITGVRLFGVRRNSPLAAIGVKNGDSIHAINGYELTSIDKMLEAYEKLKSSDNFTVSMTRRGKPVEMRYQIR